MKNDLIRRHTLHIRSRCRAAYEVSLVGAEAKKSAVGSTPCKFCDDLDVLNQVVCYLPRENGTDTPVPINFCPYCGREIV